MKKVLVFTDCDFHDTTSISLLLCQHLQKQIMILGVVCDDGFMDFPIKDYVVSIFWFHGQVEHKSNHPHTKNVVDTSK